MKFFWGEVHCIEIFHVVCRLQFLWGKPCQLATLLFVSSSIPPPASRGKRRTRAATTSSSESEPVMESGRPGGRRVGGVQKVPAEGKKGADHSQAVPK